MKSSTYTGSQAGGGFLGNRVAAPVSSTNGGMSVSGVPAKSNHHSDQHRLRMQVCVDAPWHGSPMSLHAPLAGGGVWA
jgi:hypothetical protein